MIAEFLIASRLAIRKRFTLSDAAAGRERQKNRAAMSIWASQVRQTVKGKRGDCNGIGKRNGEHLKRAAVDGASADDVGCAVSPVRQRDETDEGETGDGCVSADAVPDDRCGDDWVDPTCVPHLLCDSANGGVWGNVADRIFGRSGGSAIPRQP